MEILSRSLPGSVPPRISRKRAGAAGLLVPWESRPARPGACSGESPPTLSFLGGIPAPWACHSGKVVPAPRLQRREGIPAHPGGSEHPLRCAALRCAARSSLPVPVRAGGGTRRGSCCGRPASAGRIVRRSGSRLPPKPANPCGAAAPRGRGGTGVAGAAVATRAPPGGAWVWTRQERLEPPPIHKQVKRPGALAARGGVGGSAADHRGAWGGLTGERSSITPRRCALEKVH